MDPAPRSNEPTWRPSASITTLQHRSMVLREIRQFFAGSGYWEVETPLLSHESVVDANLSPIVVPYGNDRLYLQTSPELFMKRLLAHQADSIFQVSRAFRMEESGLLHSPEFTMIEWYRPGDSYIEQMEFVEELIDTIWLIVAGRHDSRRPPTRYPRTTYDELFERVLGCRVLEKSVGELREIALQNDVAVPPTMSEDVDAWRNLLLGTLIEPTMTETPAEFIVDYPASQAALARVRSDQPPVAERFELYLSGVEICNGYTELTDAAELEQRCEEEAARRDAEGAVALPRPERLIDAHRAGLPECSGVALGFDRLYQQLVGAPTLADVMAFPFDRA